MRFLILISLIVAVFLSIYPISAKDLQVFDYSDRTYSKKNPNQIRLHKNILTLLERAIFGKSKKRKRNRRGAVKLMLHQWKDINMETLQDFVATFPKLRWLLEQNHDIIRNYITSVASLPRRGGVTRRLRLWCRSGIGYHLEISRKGRVVARHQQSPDGLLEMVSVRTGVVAIRNSKRKYICMNRKGRLISKGKFQPECAFRERREANKFDTYASEHFSDHVTRKGFYLGIAPNGKIKRLKKYSWWQRRSQWLPRPP